MRKGNREKERRGNRQMREMRGAQLAKGLQDLRIVEKIAKERFLNHNTVIFLAIPTFST
jgi:hypothetical protein